MAMIEENGSTAFHQHLQITTIQKNASRTEGLTTIAALERGAVHAGLITSMSCRKINALELPITTIVCLNRHPKITFPQNVCTRIAALPGSCPNIAWTISRKRAPKSTARMKTEIEQVCSDVYHQLLQNTMLKRSAWLTAKRAKIVALKLRTSNRSKTNLCQNYMRVPRHAKKMADFIGAIYVEMQMITIASTVNKEI